MSHRIEIRMVRLYRVIDNETDSLVFETLDENEANFKAGFFSLSDCVNWETNTLGDCGGRVERVNDVVICETCRN